MTKETSYFYHQDGPSPFARLALAGLLSFFGAAAAQAQYTISIDYQGPSSILIGGPLDPGAAYVANPAPVPALPGLFVSSGALGIAPAFFGIGELDALSWGQDRQLQMNATSTALARGYRLVFSTDEFAIGDPALAFGAPNDLLSQGASGNQEASADMQVSSLTPVFPLPPWEPSAGFLGHFSWLDGNAAFPFGAWGIGLVEPNLPLMGLPDGGDNLDAFDFRVPVGPARLYFSLDARWEDPLERSLTNSGTASVNGVSPGDVLVSSGLGGFAVWAQAAQLGLSSDDDLDALILWDNGDGVFTPSEEPFDWENGETDMLLFSVRRQSPLIGTPDAFFNEPISEGDILTTPPEGPGTPPGIFIAAEVIGLATTRSGTAVEFDDDLNALSMP